MLILKLTPESSDEHCALASNVSGQSNGWKQWINLVYDVRDSFMAWNLGPGLIVTVWNSADENVVKCNHGRQSQLLSCRLFSIYVHVVSPLCNTKIWSVEMFFFLFLFFCNHLQIVEPESRWNSQGRRAKDCCASLQNHWHFFSYCNTFVPL